MGGSTVNRAPSIGLPRSQPGDKAPTRVSAVFCSLLFALRSLLYALRSLLASLYQTNASSGVWNPNYDSEKLLIEK